MVTAIPNAIAQAIHEHAREGYPDEACGFVLGAPGDGGVLSRVVRAKNAQDDYHARFPAEFPRTARTAYFIEPKEILAAFESARRDGLAVKILYHSHADHDAYFSDEDRRAAMFGDEPAYAVDYLVVSVRDRQIRGQKLFRFDGDTKNFREVPLG